MARSNQPEAKPAFTPPGLSRLTCENLGELDSGFAGAAIDEQIRIAVNDLEQRGEDAKARKVTIELSFVKIGSSGDVFVGVAVQAKIPPMTLKNTVGQTQPQGKGEATINFRADNPRRHDQPTLPFEEAEKDGAE